MARSPARHTAAGAATKERVSSARRLHPLGNSVAWDSGLGAAVVGNTVDERAVFDLAVELSLLTDWCRSASPAQFKGTVGRPL